MKNQKDIQQRERNKTLGIVHQQQVMTNFQTFLKAASNFCRNPDFQGNCWNLELSGWKLQISAHSQRSPSFQVIHKQLRCHWSLSLKWLIFERWIELNFFKPEPRKTLGKLFKNLLGRARAFPFLGKI